MIEEKYISELKPPACPICWRAMRPDHAKQYRDNKSFYVSIRFYCYAPSTAEFGDHRLVLSAYNPEQWAGTVERWRLHPARDERADTDSETMTVLGDK